MVAVRKSVEAIAHQSVADQNFLIFMQFLGKFVCWRLPNGGLAPPPRGILDPPLSIKFLLQCIYPSIVPYPNSTQRYGKDRESGRTFLEFTEIYVINAFRAGIFC